MPLKHEIVHKVSTSSLTLCCPEFYWDNCPWSVLQKTKKQVSTDIIIFYCNIATVSHITSLDKKCQKPNSSILIPVMCKEENSGKYQSNVLHILKLNIYFYSILKPCILKHTLKYFLWHVSQICMVSLYH